LSSTGMSWQQDREQWVEAAVPEKVCDDKRTTESDLY
jgi:hypothetical protein